MRRRGYVLLVPLFLACMSACSDDRDTIRGTPADRPEAARVGDDKKADNTAVNERDKNDATLTPLDQGENEADRGVTQRARKAIVADDSLSTNAHNIKIITREGVVTLRGPVNTAEEEKKILVLMQGISGVNRVENQLEIAAR